MNPKIKKLKAEKERNVLRITEMTSRNEEIDKQVTELENLDIIGIVRENSITPEGPCQPDCVNISKTKS